MTKHDFPRGLASLVHHVELSTAGWHTRALELMAICVLYECGGVCTRTDLIRQLSDRLPTGIDADNMSKVIHRLVKAGKVLEPDKDSIKLSEEMSAELEGMEKQHDELEGRVRERFDRFTKNIPDSVRPQWETFQEQFLTPLVLDLGARTYEFLSGDTSPLPLSSSYPPFITEAPTGERSSIVLAIEAFLDPKDKDIRAYVLRLLNAVFLVQATGISESAVESLDERSKKRLKLVVFVDTNFFFSLIGLHENPADDVVAVLNRIISELHERLDVRLYILPSTLDEARRTVGGYASALSGLVLDKALADAVRRGTSDLSGITLKFIREAATSPKGLSAEEYFRPYLENTLTVARSKGVELFNESLDDLRQDQEVIDDVLASQEYEKRTKGEDKAKKYEVLLHDMILWHFTRRKRPTRLDSYVDATYWVATMDFGLLGFDRYKVRRHAANIPICMHPTVLLQVLQLWIPRSDLLDAALVDSLRPLLPHVFDSEAEQITLRILRALSRFENIGDLSPGTMSHVLFDGAIRARVAQTDEVEEQIELVRDAIVEQARKLEEQTNTLMSEAATLKAEINLKDKRIAALESDLDKKNHERSSLETAVNEKTTVVTTLEGRVAELEKWIDNDRRFRKARDAVVREGSILLAGAIGLAVLAFWRCSRWVLPAWLTTAAVPVVFGGTYLLVLEWRLRRHPETRMQPLARAVTSIRKALWTAIITVLLGVIAAAIWASVKGT